VTAVWSMTSLVAVESIRSQQMEVEGRNSNELRLGRLRLTSDVLLLLSSHHSTLRDGIVPLAMIEYESDLTASGSYSGSEGRSLSISMTLALFTFLPLVILT
jgi:hypothetical protein